MSLQVDYLNPTGEGVVQRVVGKQRLVVLVVHEAYRLCEEPTAASVNRVIFRRGINGASVRAAHSKHRD